jgi:polyketide biosynthesis acyl carrier protein
VQADDILAAIRENLCEVVPEIDPAAVTIDARMADLGCSSADRAEVVAMVMAQLDVAVPVMRFGAVSDIRSLVELLHEYA